MNVPVLVVQGESDRFGIPPPAAHRTVVRLRGDHSLRSDAAGLADAVREWLPRVLAHPTQQRRTPDALVPASPQSASADAGAPIAP